MFLWTVSFVLISYDISVGFQAVVNTPLGDYCIKMLIIVLIRHGFSLHEAFEELRNIWL